MTGVGRGRYRILTFSQAPTVTFVSLSLPCICNNLNESVWLIRKALSQGIFNKGTEFKGFISPEYRAVWKLGEGDPDIRVPVLLVCDRPLVLRQVPAGPGGAPVKVPS